MDADGRPSLVSLVTPARASLLPLALAAAAVLGGCAPRLRWHEEGCVGSQYRYLLYQPGRRSPVPALVLLHGAGGEPSSMLVEWYGMAQQDGFALIAPVLPMAAGFERVAPRVLRCLVEDAAARVSLDRNRVYLFGYSMGGRYAYDAAMLESGYFAAAAVFAMGITRSRAWRVDSAVRRTPIAIYIGDQDPLVPLALVRRTRDLLRSRGFPVHYRELAGRDHGYFAVADSINADAWAFLSRYRLSDSATAR